MSAEWIGIAFAGLGVLGTLITGAIAYGRVQEKVNGNAEAHEHCEQRREKMESRIFHKLDDLAESVNKVKGALRIDGD